MRRHREIKVPDEPFVDWERKRYTGPKVDLSAAEQAEVETDRDLGKPVEQLLCDVYEGYTYWQRIENSPDTPEEMKTPVELILYTMCRAASMNAVVAKENAALQKSVKRLTCGLWILTVILVLLGLAQFGLPYLVSDARSPVAEVSENTKKAVEPGPPLLKDDSRNKEPSNNRLERPAGSQSNSEGSGAITGSAQPGSNKPSSPAAAQP